MLAADSDSNNIIVPTAMQENQDRPVKFKATEHSIPGEVVRILNRPEVELGTYICTIRLREMAVLPNALGLSAHRGVACQNFIFR